LIYIVDESVRPPTLIAMSSWRSRLAESDSLAMDFAT